MSKYDEDWALAAAGPLTAIRNREVAHHDLDPKQVHQEAQQLLVRISGDLHVKRARAVLLEALLQWKREDSEDFGKYDGEE